MIQAASLARCSSSLLVGRRLLGRPQAAATATAAAGVVPRQRFFSGKSSEEDARSLAASQPPPAAAEKGFLGKLLDGMSIRGQQERIETAEMLFQAATRQASDPLWYGPGRVPREFRSRHAMLTMHLWFLHRRLISSTASNGRLDKDTCLRIQEELFEIFWNDTLCRLRGEPNVREMSVNKYLLQVQQYTFLHLFHYDHIFGALKSSQSHLDAPPSEDEEGQGEQDVKIPPSLQDEMEDVDMDMELDPTVDLNKRDNRIAELKKLIWRHVMVRDPQAKKCQDQLERMAWYVEAQYQNILVKWPGQYVQDARVGWVTLPNFDNLKDTKGNRLRPQECHPDDIIPSPWLKNVTLRGEYYYWNPTNGKSQWEKPTFL